MKIFTTGVLAVLLATLAPFSLNGQGASGAAELQSVPALKARVAELEADLVKMRQLKEENKRLRRQLRKARAELFDLQARAGSVPQDAASQAGDSAKIDAEKKKILEAENEAKEKSKGKSDSFWDWLAK